MSTILPIYAGKLLCRPIRNFLEECKFKGMNVEWVEQKGFSQNTFLIKGSQENLKSILYSIKTHFGEEFIR